MHAQPQAQADFFRSSPLLTYNDLTDDQAVHDAAHALRRAGADQAALAAWAIRWGDLLVARCDETSDMERDLEGEARLREQIDDADEAAIAVAAVGREVVREIEGATSGDDVPRRVRQAIASALGKLENVL